VEARADDGRIRQSLAGRPTGEVVAEESRMLRRIQDAVEKAGRIVPEGRDPRSLCDDVLASVRVVMQLHRLDARRRDGDQLPQRVVIHRRYAPYGASQRRTAGRAVVAARGGASIDGY